ncbi:DNA polymerase epsilon subunit c [Phlyctema vagabunda]|uniref:DNA polymerase epsilon subunit c n=1 Tax=Phlyctema vagabunda TaxID=108571 RepID=A0ABR4PJT5_9HELO
MDFWSRLIAGTSLAPAASKKGTNNPEKRLARFKREYSQLLTTWQRSTNLSKDLEAADDIRSNIAGLTALLTDESRRPLPHPCITFASAKQVYISIGKIATTSYNEYIIREAVGLFATLIESEEESFVENDAFAKSLMNLLVRITGANAIRLGRDTEVEVVELSFNITTKIRLDPEVLPAWFTAQNHGESSEGRNAHEKFTGKTHKEDFPLFYLLIDYIHEEGRIGDFARTGLLYIIEAASNSVELEQWIVESDLATMMATGLGALYGQLSRKLVIDHPRDELPPVLAFSDYQHPTSTFEIISSTSQDFQIHMETFLSHLMFWQDVLNHCKSVEVKATLLEHFQVIFLQQLLYPSLLESSDVDGGSSVAVLFYLRRVLESVDHPDMIQLILHYLLALPDSTSSKLGGSRTSVSAARKRKSLDLATLMATQVVDTPSTPALFNLVDLILGSLRSQSQQTISVTLQLVSVILKRHHRYAVSTLLQTYQVITDEPQRTVGGHDKELEYLLSLASELGGDDTFDEAYENHIEDCKNILESHPCSIPLIAPKSIIGGTKSGGAHGTVPGAPRDIRAHSIRPEDPILEILLDILKGFLTNAVETNLCLTGTIVDMATCGFMHVEGWLVPDPSRYAFDEEELVEDILTSDFDDLDDVLATKEERQLRAVKNARRLPNWSKSEIPSVLTILGMLVEQVASYRIDIPRFDDLLQQRRDTFQAASSVMTSAVPIPQRNPPRSSFESPTSSPPRTSAFDALAQRIFPELGTPSRSRSPRGRSSQEYSNGGASGGYGTGTPTSSKGSVAPPQFPMGLETPPGRTSRGYSASPGRDGEGSHRGLGVPASQAAAFAAVDQSILARKVGLPTSTKPIPFPDLRESKAESSATTKDAVNEDAKEGGDQKLVTVSHILTNVIMLQEFILELAALVQVRAGLFGEIKFA